MGFFDNLKKNLTNQVTNTVNHQTSQAITNGVKGAADAIKGAAKPKKTKTFTFTSLPTNVAELQALRLPEHIKRKKTKDIIKAKLFSYYTP